MPTRIAASPTRNGLPLSVQRFLDQISVNPVATEVKATEPMLQSIGKPISELLGLILKPTQKGSGIPQRLRLTNWNADKGTISFHGASRAGQYEATPQQIDELINGGVLDLEQAPQRAMEAMRRKLLKLLP